MTTDAKPESTTAPADDQAAYHAGLRDLLSGKDEEPAPEPKTPAEPATGAEEPADDADEPDAEEADAEEDDSDEEGEDPKVAEESLRKLQKERRSFERHKTEVLEKERQVAAREEQINAAEKNHQRFYADLNDDPLEALLSRRLISEGDLAAIGRLAYLRSPEGLKNPQSKAEAEKLLRERARDAQARKAMERVEKLEEERARERAEIAEEKQLNEYTSRIKATTGVFKAKTPLLTKAMEKDPATTERELWQVAYELAKANGGNFAEPGKVVLAWEKQQRERIARLGLDAPQPAAVQAQAKTKTAAKSQGQPTKESAGAPSATEPAEEAVLEGDAYYAELRRRLKQG